MCQALLDAISTPTLLLNVAGSIVYANPAAQSLFKQGLRAILHTAPKQWFNLDANSASLEKFAPISLDEALEQVITHPGQPLKLDVHLNTSLEPLQAVISATESQGSQADWPIAIELLNHAPALMIQAAEHRAAQQGAQRELLRNLAHEIRNPLGGIRGAAQLLARELGQSKQREYTDVIVAETSRLQTLLDQLLSAQATPRTLSLVNIHEIIERVRSIVSAEHREVVAWRRDYDVSLPEIALDAHQMVQVLLNVVRNAAQIMVESNTPHKRISISTRALRQVTLGTRRHKLALELLIEDNGPGISATMMPQLFSPLVSQRAGGTGLGLHIAHSFVLQHGGSIEADSQPGCTRFKIVLPARVELSISTH